jgi:DNA repair photolyase
MFHYMDLLRDYDQYWYVSITPYGRDIEPNVPDKHRLLEDFRKLSDMVGTHSIGWRYDPILLSDRYTMEYQIHAFDQIASALDGYTQTVVISFIDLYPKVRRNFPEAREVTKAQRLALGKEIIQIASAHGMTVKPCAEGDELAAFGADCGGCMRISDYEKAIGRHLHVPKKRGARAECACYLACDIGAYNTCRHLCKYCYANAEPDRVLAHSRLHDPNSPFLIGNYMDGDRIHDVPQKSWIDDQIRLELG